MRISNVKSKLAIILICAMLLASAVVLFQTVDSFGVANADNVALVDGSLYMFKNKASGYYMEVHASAVNNNVNTLQKPKTAKSNQIFMLKSKGNGNWLLVPMHVPAQNYVLDVEGASTSSGASVNLFQNNNGLNQQFKFSPNADGSYKITTRASNYSLAIGMRYNSYSPGEICVQTAKSNATTNWYVERIWNYTSKGNTYSLNTNLPTPISDPELGTPTLVKEETIYNKFVTGTHPIHWDTHESYPDYHIRYWKYSTIFNAPVAKLTNFRKVDAGNTLTIRGEETDSVTKTIEQSITESKSEASGITAGIKSAFENLVISLSYNYQITETTQKTLTYGTSKTYSVSNGFSQSYNNQSGHSQFLRVEKRGMMNFYIVQVFKYNYRQNSRKSGLWTYYSYTPISKVCSEEMFNWFFDLNAIEEGIYAYKYDTVLQRYIYDDNRINGIIYI